MAALTAQSKLPDVQGARAQFADLAAQAPYAWEAWSLDGAAGDQPSVVDVDPDPKNLTI